MGHEARLTGRRTRGRPRGTAQPIRGSTTHCAARSPHPAAPAVADRSAARRRADDRQCRDARTTAAGGHGRTGAIARFRVARHPHRSGSARGCPAVTIRSAAHRAAADCRDRTGTARGSTACIVADRDLHASSDPRGTADHSCADSERPRPACAERNRCLAATDTGSDRCGSAGFHAQLAGTSTGIRPGQPAEFSIGSSPELLLVAVGCGSSLGRRGLVPVPAPAPRSRRRGPPRLCRAHVRRRSGKRTFAAAVSCAGAKA